ncbi:hypothetical protein SUGI_0801790 [Cryptomeria japonica]|nr:hypothetical protein SUGI_0801790 [Cryptomeria japonica]
MLGINKSLADNQCAPLTGLGIRNNNLGIMEQHLQMPGTSTVVQYESNNMLAALHEISTLNSNIYQVESKTEREPSEIAGQELFGEAMVAVRTSSINNLHEKNMLPPASALQYAASQSESSASLSLIPFTNKSTGVNTSPLPKVEVNVECVYRYPTIYSGCIQTCAFDCGENFMSHLSVGSPDLLDSGLLTSEPGKIEQQPWLEESSQKYEAVFSEDGLVETLNYAEGSFEDLESFSQNHFVIRYGHCDSSEDVPSDCKLLKSVIRDQDYLPNAVSKPFEMDKAFQTLESALVTKTDTDARDENLLLERKLPELRCLPQLYGISSGSTCHSVVTQCISPSMDTDMEGGLSYETNSEHLLDAVVGNLYSRANHGTDDNASSKMTSSGLSTMGVLCSPSVRTDTCLVGQADGLKQTEFIVASPSQCMLDKGNIHNFCNIDNVHPVNQDHTVIENLTNESPSITHKNSGIDDCESSRCDDSLISQAKTSASMVKVNRKRARSGESGRPRPKDRQQIQDRVKELREIIPNGIKCSIDSLLARTIKHMIFLQIVTKHAENLKQSCEKKVGS